MLDGYEERGLAVGMSAWLRWDMYVWSALVLVWVCV